MRLLGMAAEPKVLATEELDDLVSRLAELCDRFGVVLMYLHGSHGNGTHGHLSDLDIAVLLGSDAASEGRKQLELLAALQETSGREDVDLIVLNTAGSIIKDRVVRHGRLVYAGNQSIRVRFEAATIKEALDFEYFSRVYDDALFTQLREGRFLG